MTDDRLHVIMRPMTLDDIEEVVVLDRLSFPTPWPARTYQYEIENNEHAFMLVLEHSLAQPASPGHDGLWERLKRFVGLETPPVQRLVGYSGCWYMADEAHISTIAVHPDWRGKKLGELMIWCMVRQAFRRGSSMVTLEVRVGNTVAQNLYRKYGFEIVGRRKGYYRDNGEDAYMMTLTPLDENCRARQAEFGRQLARYLRVTDRVADPFAEQVASGK
jgi:ribosomal-protein-alanine N-acetyltransferase